MYNCSLRSKRFHSSYCAKVRAEAKKRLKEEREGRRGSFFPLPRHSIFFCSCPCFLDEPREETLATQASTTVRFFLGFEIFLFLSVCVMETGIMSPDVLKKALPIVGDNRL